MHFGLSDYVMDAVHNSIQAGAANITLKLLETGTPEEPGDIVFEVIDDGCGMDERQLARAVDPFYTDGSKHPGRKMGLGLPFLKQLLDETGGEFSLESLPGNGTSLSCRFKPRHIDTPPLGDVAGACMTLFSYPGSFELELRRERFGRRYSIVRSELLEALGSFDGPEELMLLNRFLESQEDFHGENDP